MPSLLLLLMAVVAFYLAYTASSTMQYQSTSSRSEPTSSQQHVVLAAARRAIARAEFQRDNFKRMPQPHAQRQNTKPEQSAGGEVTTTSARASALVAAPCEADQQQQQTELDGAVVTPGGRGGLQAQTAKQCCEKCLATRGCNVYVFSSAGDGACWLKRTDAPSAPVAVRGKGPRTRWTSGVLMKDAALPSNNVADMLSRGAAVGAIQLHTPMGVIKMRLMHDWHRPSAEYVGAIAASDRQPGAAWSYDDLAAVPAGHQPDVSADTHAALCTSACAFYRAEPGFLIQGSLRALIPSNTLTQPGPKLMERGDVGWAGGFSGPDFFIYLGHQPAQHFGNSHTVFGTVDDASSLAVADAIAHATVRPTRPGEMHMLAKPLPFDIDVLE